MRRSLTMLVLLLLAGFTGAHAESAPQERRFGVYVNAGLFDKDGRWGYEHIGENGTYETTPFLGVGLQYDVGHIYSSPVGVAVEVNEIQIRVTEQGKRGYYGGAAEASGYIVPVEVWGYASSPGRFGPFIRVGVGALRTKITESFTEARYTDNVFESWSFCYDYGGGLRFSVSERFDLMAYIEGPTATEEIAVSTEYGSTRTLLAPRVYALYGLRVAYRF
jgi:hypothetical protein